MPSSSFHSVDQSRQVSVIVFPKINPSHLLQKKRKVWNRWRIFENDRNDGALPFGESGKKSANLEALPGPSPVLADKNRSGQNLGNLLLKDWPPQLPWLELFFVKPSRETLFFHRVIYSTDCQFVVTVVAEKHVKPCHFASNLCWVETQDIRAGQKESPR